MKSFINFLVVLLLTLSLTSCEVIGGIFKAGVWTGVIAIVAVIGIVIWIIAKMFGGGNR